MSAIFTVKNWLLPPERRPRKILTGSFRGITMELSPQSHMQLYLGLYERETYGWLNRLSQDIGSAVDIGAGEGMFTLYFFHKTEAAKIFAFEPEPSRVPLLRHSLFLNQINVLSEINGDGRVEISSKSVGAENTERELRLDSLIHRVVFPCLIRVDLDEHEVDVLKGAYPLLGGRDVRWLIETHSKKLEQECVEIFKDAGYETRIIPNAWWRFVFPEKEPIEQIRWLAAWPSR